MSEVMIMFFPGRDGGAERGWRYTTSTMRSIQVFGSYPMACRAAIADGHEVYRGGWQHKVPPGVWINHSLDGFPEWQIESGRLPASATLHHVYGVTESAHDIALAWDDAAAVDFYKSEQADAGQLFVHAGDSYRSCWYFATVAERDRFLVWHRERERANAGK